MDLRVQRILGDNMRSSRPLTAVVLCLAVLLSAAVGGATYAPRAIDRLAYSAQYPASQSNLSGASGVAFNKLDGTYWVADPKRHRVVNVTADGKVLKTLGGLGLANGRFNSPSGVWVHTSGADPLRGRIYVADSGNARVQVFDASGNFVFKLGSFGTGNGQMRHPVDLETDALGSIFVVDDWNHRVQKYDAEGNYLSVVGGPLAGAGNGQFSEPAGISISGDRVYVTDSINDRVEAFDNGLVYQYQFGTEGPADTQFSFPKGIEASGTSLTQFPTFWIADSGNQSVKHIQVNPSTQAITLLHKVGVEGAIFDVWNKHVSSPRDIVVPDANGADIAVVDTLGLRLFSGAAPYGQTRAFLPVDRAYRPESVAVGTGGALWVSGHSPDAADNEFVYKYSWSGGTPVATGPFIDEYSFGGTTYLFAGIVDMDTDAQGNLYILDSQANKVVKLNSTGQCVAAWGGWGALAGQFKNASGIDVYNDKVYVADTGNTRLQSFSLDGTFVTQYGDVTTMPELKDVVVTPNGMYTIDTASSPTDEIRRFTSAGVLLDKAAGPFSGPDALVYPEELTADVTGDIYAVDSDGRVQKYTETLEWLGSLGSTGVGAGQFVQPKGLAINSIGTVFVADNGNDRIQVLVPARKTTTKAFASSTAPAYNGSVTVAFELLDADGKFVPNERLSAYRSFDGKTWTWVGEGPSVATPADGMWVGNITRKVWYQTRLKADGDHIYAPESTRASVLIKPQVKLTKPAAPTSVRRGARFTIYGYLEPRHAAGAYSVRVKTYRKSGSSWVYSGYVRAKNVNYGSKTKYVVAGSIGTAGTYKLVAYAPVDSGHSATTALGYDVVYVK